MFVVYKMIHVDYSRTLFVTNRIKVEELKNTQTKDPKILHKSTNLVKFHKNMYGIIVKLSNISGLAWNML